MNHLSKHRRVLELAEAGKLPLEINAGGKNLPIDVVHDLYEHGYLDARHANGFCYVDPRITMPGRGYLRHLQDLEFEASLAGKARSVGMRLLDAGLGFAVGVLTAWATGGGAG